MAETQLNNPLHGITLETVVKELHAYYGWKRLGTYVDINCFKSNQTIKSSLKFLRQQQWARTKVEDLYLSMLKEKERMEGKKVSGEEGKEVRG